MRLGGPKGPIFRNFNLLVDLVKAVWTKRAVYPMIGASLGFAYYYFIGCHSGTCPITSNPWISTAYGAGMGFLMAFGGGRREGKSNEPADPSMESSGKVNGKVDEGHY